MAICITDHKWIWDKTRNIILTPQSRTARQLPYIAPQHRGAKGYLFCPCERSEIGEAPQGEGVEKIP